MLQKRCALTLRLVNKGAHLHTIKLYLVKLKGVGIACIHTLLIHLQQSLAVGKSLVEHGQCLVETYKIDAKELCLEQYVATLLDKKLLSYDVLHLCLLVACSILCGEVDFLANHKLALCHA